jgi:branched-chain amino acid transport system permease protein
MASVFAPVRNLWRGLPSPVRRFGPGILLVLLAVLAPLLTTGGDGWLSPATLVYCAIYALFAMGLNIVVGYAGLLDLGYVAFFLFGAYVAAWLMSDFFFKRQIHFLDTALPAVKGIHVSFWLVMIVAGVVAAIIGVIIGAPTLRLKSDYLALVTLGFGEILPEVFRNGEDIFGYNFTNGTKGIGPIDKIGTGFLNQATFGGLPKAISPADNTAKYYVILFLCALYIYVSIRLRGGKLGRAWLAIREDELAASLMGVPLMRTKLWSYAIGAFAGGVAGTFYATVVGIVNVDNFNFNFSIIVLCAVILGGTGNVWGSIVGGIVIMWFNYSGLVWFSKQMNERVLGKISDGWQINLKNYEFAFFGLVLVLMMLFRPQGIIPAARAKQVDELEKKLATVGAEG